ncbi:S8 family serine peptidase [Paenibacillus puldeungensis]|uniref:S8 family serine peptidase n=1 Tax=Paenibacillus puldeungensis TaxID=696536 RepID=A0ABW3RSS6_9BACL
MSSGSRKIIAGLLSFLLAFTLLLPAAGANDNATQESGGAKSIVSRLDQQVLSAKTLETAGEIDVQSKHHAAGSNSSKSPLTSEKPFTMEPQESSLSSESTPQSYVPLSDSTESISVIVELEKEPVKVFEANESKKRSINSITSHKQSLKLEQQSFKQQATSKLGVKISREYSEIFNGYSLTIAADRVNDLLQLPGVKAVYPNSTVYATADSQASDTPEDSVPFIGSRDLWNKGIKGQGIKVGVIDTGVAKDHPDLAGAIPSGDWGYDFVNDDSEPYETTKEDYYKAKEKDPTLPEVNDKGKPYWTSHGSHVSGIVGGRSVGAAGQPGVVGVAPETEIHAYKVLGPYGSGSTEDVIAGIEKAVTDGMDVINLSLGSEGNNQQSADSVAVNNAVKAGVIASVSSGNSGPAEATVGDPGTSELAITVGASKPPLVTPIMKVTEMDGEQFYTDSFDKSTGIETLTDSYPLVDVGLGKPADYAGKDLTGKIAFIKRGEISFADKAKNVMASGAAGAIVYNNAPEALESGTLGDAVVTIPIYALSGVYGEKIKAALSQKPLSVTFSKTIEQDIMGAFSSRGPAKPAYDIKPDISAPGISIRSSVPEYEGWYKAQNGTSMAAPHVAGAVALLKQYYPELEPYEIKALLMNNAKKLVDRNGNRYTHMDQGAGRIALDQVIQAKAIAMTEDTTSAVNGNMPTPYFTGSLSFGYVSIGSSAQRQVVVKGIDGQASKYSVTTKWFGETPLELSVSKNEVLVGAKGQDSFTVTVNVPAQAAGQRYEGELILTETGSGHVLSMPISVYAGEAPHVDIVTDLQVKPNAFSPNGDGSSDTSDITFKINEYTNYFSLDVYSLGGKWLGSIMEEIDGVKAGSYIIRGWKVSGLPDGGYLLVPWVGNSPVDSVPIENQLTKFIIDTEAPVSQLSNPAVSVAYGQGTISGQVTKDTLIDLLVSEKGLRISDVIGVAALVDANGDGNQEQVDGTIDDTGHFTINVPVAPGDNTYEVYVYDLAGNGLLTPAHTVNYKYTISSYVAPSVKPDKVRPNQPFTVDAAFSVTDEVYSAKFDLLYSKKLGNASVTPSPELSKHQAEGAPGKPLTVTETVYEQTADMTRHSYFISLNDTAGYKGSGSLATFSFAGAPMGQYSFEIANLVLLGRDGHEVPVDLKPSVQVDVREQPVLRAEPKALSLLEGASGKLTVSYTGEDGSKSDVTDAVYYTVKNPQIATVLKGVVTGKGAGSTSVEITYKNLTETVNVTVTKAVTPPGGGGGGSSSGGSSSTPTPKVTTPLSSGAVKTEIKKNEPTVVTLPNGFTLTIPAGAISPAEAVYVQVTPASEAEAKMLVSSLKLGLPNKTFGTYYDIAVLDKAGKVIENASLSQPGTASIPLEALAAGQTNGEKISLFKVGTGEKLTQHIGRLVANKVIAQVNSFSRYMYMAKDISFSDVTKANFPWAVNQIEVLASKDIITGTDANLFAPNTQVTRAEFISLLVWTLELKADKSETAKVKFSDVPAGSWYEEAVQIAAAKGLIGGYEGGKFAPNKPITRAEMAVVLSKALSASGGSQAATTTAASFADQSQIPAWAKEAIAKVTGLGTMQGRADNRFDPHEVTTRAEAAVVMYRIFKGTQK